MPTLIDQYQHNVTKGPHYKDLSSLPTDKPASPPVKYIAYYLPQFHEIQENNEWWGPGFTEWTNVTKALPRYVGHYQPRLPADLGFYDLSRPETLRRQVDLAKRGGVHGFCFHNYWFSGRSILQKPLQNLLDHPDIDMPFCLNWANESWSRRWDGSENELLLEQRYDPGDVEGYVDSIAGAIRDPRYIRISGRPLVMIYRPAVIPDAAVAIRKMRARFEALGLGNPYFTMPQVFGANDPDEFGMDAAAGFAPQNAWDGRNRRQYVRLLDRDYHGAVLSYDRLVELFREHRPDTYRLFPGVCPDWNNEARRTNKGFGFFGSTPAKYGRWLRHATTVAARAQLADERIVFINAWNEWAEGAYLEPDRHFGAAYLIETRRALDDHANGIQTGDAMSTEAHRPFDVRPSSWNFIVNARHAVRRRLAKL